MRIPTSTYRLQINAEFPFRRVRELADYFEALGVGDLYFAPVFQARARSPHGYDVTNPGQFNREVGDEPEFEQLSADVRARGMGLLLDIVPNHMAASEDNPWWHDILEHGPASHAAHFFDVAWDVPGAGSRIILPVLGRELDDAIAAGELGIALRDGEIAITYFQRRFPLDPATYGDVLRKVAGIDASIIEAADSIRPRTERSPQDREQRRATSLTLKQKLAEHPSIDIPQLDETELRALIDRQAYRLAFWRTGTRNINYRRFFDITDLAGVRVEDPDVFATTHSLILELLRTGQIQGVRIDHVDGLRDPGGYLRDLRNAIGDEYVVVEKILAPNEDLREDWPVEGTTGYDFIGMMGGLFCDAEGLGKLTELYHRRTGMSAFDDLVYEKKKSVIDALFAGELQALTHELAAIARAAGSSLASDELAACITEVTACLPVYRTYISGDLEGPDRCIVKHAVTTARHRAPNVPETAFALLKCVLLGDDALPAAARPLRADFIANWQQFTGPVTAKGVEDTAFYNYNRLIALSEVGAQPDSIVASATEFHEVIGKRAARWPYTMNASSTHDTKRSEDVRARILVLSEVPDVWDQAVERWNRLTESHRRTVNGRPTPDANERLLIYQTLLGVWPLHKEEEAALPERLKLWLQKSVREAKLNSSWLEPNEAYEQALFDYTHALLRDATFQKDFAQLLDTVAWYGALNSLSQLVIKLGAPGVPDIYQGNESWVFALVDPDNRRPVDYDRLRRQLQTLPIDVNAQNAAALLRDWRDGRIKQHVTRSLLKLRRQRPDLFANGSYAGLEKHGRFARNVVPFVRRLNRQWVLVAAGRYFASIGPRPTGSAWADTSITLPPNAPAAWRNVLTGEVTDGRHLEAVFATLPFAVLEGV